MPRKTETKTVKKTVSPAQPLVGIIMGSQSDWATMENAANVLESFGVVYESLIVSAHRTPKRLFEYATMAAERGIKIIIAGAGGAAHLPGMTASLTALPVLGVPVTSRSLDGLDSLLSIAQMPAGVPVGTLAVGTAGAINAGLLAVSILALQDDRLAALYAEWRDVQTASVAKAPKDEEEAKPAKKAAVKKKTAKK
ncbi:MAG: 5-(carboxyamino)imidazole ribonucleotide mutase [Alphaproteobacteria bacterium]|nr:5-(carboxyamino)imidazole ribonucleotide mutase [Alphaproteobacteria bacterium]